MEVSKTTRFIANRLKSLRSEHNLTQVELAEKAGINPNAYAKIERMERQATITTLEKIAKALKVSSSDILPF
jgi:transcriptional regulator with XRE-family HTH domain